jgi:hypothetical protein
MLSPEEFVFGLNAASLKRGHSLNIANCCQSGKAIELVELMACARFCPTLVGQKRAHAISSTNSGCYMVATNK